MTSEPCDIRSVDKRHCLSPTNTRICKNLSSTRVLKRRAYNDRPLQFEERSLRLLIYTTTGGVSCGSDAVLFYHRPTELLAENKSWPSRTVAAWLRGPTQLLSAQVSPGCFWETRMPNRVESLSGTSINVTVSNGE